MYVLLRGWQGDTGSGNGMGQVYNSSGNIVENMTGTGIQPVGDTNPLTGLNNWGNEIAASNNHYYGCAVYNLDQNPSIYSNGTAFADSAAVAGGNTNVTYTDMAVVNCKRWAFGGGNNTTDWGGGDYGTRLRNCTVYSATNATSGGHTKVGFRDNSSYPNGSKNVRNCIADTMWNGIEDNSGVAVSEYNCYWNCNNVYTGSTPISPPGTGDTTVIDPAWDTATFGTGAYLMPPAALAGLGEGGTDMGADVRYCYVDGALTTKRLWPWPMEGRIAAEAGVSATYEVDPGGSAATTFIGPWKTLAGVYP